MTYRTELEHVSKFNSNGVIITHVATYTDAYTLATTKPPYGELTDMLDAPQLEATSKNKHTMASMLLLQNLRQKYKHL